MEEKSKVFFQKLYENKKKQVIFFVISMIILSVIYIVVVSFVQKISEKEVLSKLSPILDYQVLFEIEDVVKKDGKLEFSGWMLRVDSKNKNVWLVFNEVNETEIKILKTSLIDRNDVGNYFMPNWNFGNCGFVSEVKCDEFKKDVCYEVFLVLDYVTEKEIEGRIETLENKRKVSTGYYLFNDMLYRYNPQNFYEPQVIDEEILDVIKKGVLRGYDLNEKIWVYQYNRSLYFLIGSDFGFMEDVQIGIPVMPHTTREDLLPESRISYGFDHLGFYFENKDYLRDGIEDYQVVVVTLPTEYPMTYIATGLYNAIEESWMKEFNIPMADWSFEQSR